MKKAGMKNNEKSPEKKSGIKRRMEDMERKKAAWKQYEMRIRRSNSGSSELDMD
jgi:hypothetical protein